VSAPGLRATGPLVTRLIERELACEGLPSAVFAGLEPADLILAKTADRSVLGCMNDMAFLCRYTIAESGGLMRTDLGALNRSLRRNINSARGYQAPDRAGGPALQRVRPVKPGSTALASLRPQEAVQVLAWLIGSHPELVAEMENLAAEAIAPPSREQVEASVSKRLRGLEIEDLAGLGQVAEAHQVAVGVLAGLYACGDVAGPEVLGYVELPDRADEVMRFLARQEIPLPAGACAVCQCCWAHGPTPATRSTVMWVMYPGGGLSMGGKRTSGPR